MAQTSTNTCGQFKNHPQHLSLSICLPLFTHFFLMNTEEILYETEHPKTFLYKLHLETTEKATEH